MASESKTREAWWSKDLFETGIGYVLVARFKGNGDVEAGFFLIDVYCLGAKNADSFRGTSGEYKELLAGLFPDEGGEEISPECGRKFVEDSVAYARRLGLAPHPDYKLGCRVFGGINPAICERSFTFGSEGKPLYIQGPNDSPAFVERVLRSLNPR
ncbi:MAG: hypothetical protein EXS31_11285 [Pedosphaera sp.]|nr:hypothetical protein [Pedosphaera sp.]